MKRPDKNRQAGCSLADGFSIWEKAYAQISFWIMGISGTIGIVLVDWPWVLPYIVVYWYGVPGIIMRHLLCPRCPHLHEYGDCLQAPVSMTKWFMKKKRTTPVSRSEKNLFLFIFLLIPTYPVFWLRSNTTLLVVFVVAAGMWYSGQFFHFCRRCRVSDCPFNRVPSKPRTNDV